MSDTGVAEILNLPVEERLCLVELIWESLAAIHRPCRWAMLIAPLIDERLAEHERNPDDIVSRDKVLVEARRG